MQLKKVIDEFGREVTIDEDSQKIYSYSNKKKIVTYSARIVENSALTNFWTNYTVNGTVTNLEDKLRVWNNILLGGYSKAVDFDSRKNDPDKKIWKKFVEQIRNEEDKYFDKYGDFKSKYLVSEKEIAKINNHIAAQEH